MQSQASFSAQRPAVPALTWVRVTSWRQSQPATIGGVSVNGGIGRISRCCHRCSRIRAAEILHAVPWNPDQLSVHCTGYRYHRSDRTGYPQIHREEVIFYDHVSKKAGSSAVLQQNSLLLFRCPFSASGSACCSGNFPEKVTSSPNQDGGTKCSAASIFGNSTSASISPYIGPGKNIELGSQARFR